MAAKGKRVVSKAQKIINRYYDYRRRAQAKITKWEKAGYTVPKSMQLPAVPKKITEASIRRLGKITSKEANKQVEKYQQTLPSKKQEIIEEKQQDYAYAFNEAKEERVQPESNKTQSAIQTIEKLKEMLEGYDPFDWFKFSTHGFASYKTNAVNRISSMLDDALQYFDDYSDGDVPESVIAYAAYIEKHALVLQSTIEQVAFKDSGGKDHSGDIDNMNYILEILLGGKLPTAMQITINDVMGA